MKYTINAGKFRHSIEIQSPVGTQDSYGASTGYTTIASIRGNVNNLNGRTLYQASQVNSEVSIKVTIRYRSDVQPKQRIKYGSRIFEILSIIDIGEYHRIMELMCKELI